MFSLKELIEHSFFFKKEWNVIGLRTCEQAENARTIEEERRHFVYFGVLYFFIKTIAIYFVIVSIRSNYYNGLEGCVLAISNL